MGKKAIHDHARKCPRPPRRDRRLALPQLADAQALERRHLVDDVQLQRVLSFLGVSGRSTRVDSEPRFPGERKAIRDKKERFFERKGGQEVVAPVPESAAGAKKERPGRLRKSYECESQVAVRVTRLGISRPGICLWSQEALLRADYGPGQVNAAAESVRGPVVRVPGFGGGAVGRVEG